MPQTEHQKIRSRLRSYERKLQQEKKKFGYYHDGAGKRYQIGPHYMLLGDNEGALQAFAWFEQEFDDDIGKPDLRRQALLDLEVSAREALSPLERVERDLHPWSSFAIMPVFALANAGVQIEASSFTDPVAHATFAGLFIGKPAGTLLVAWLAVRLGLARLPEGVTWGVLTGGGFLAGIGSTMALFIASLALQGSALDAAKIGTLGASALAAITGIGILLVVLPRVPSEPPGRQGSPSPRSA